VAAAQGQGLIAADSSTWVALLDDEVAPDTDLLRRALVEEQVRMVPAVLTELLSRPALRNDLATELAAVVLLEATPGYWQRAGLLRAKLLALGRKAALGDALIAQSCLDHNLPLLTRDRDFHAFTIAGLKLAPHR